MRKQYVSDEWDVFGGTHDKPARVFRHMRQWERKNEWEEGKARVMDGTDPKKTSKQHKQHLIQRHTIRFLSGCIILMWGGSQLWFLSQASLIIPPHYTAIRTFFLSCLLLDLFPIPETLSWQEEQDWQKVVQSSIIIISLTWSKWKLSNSVSRLFRFSHHSAYSEKNRPCPFFPHKKCFPILIYSAPRPQITPFSLQQHENHDSISFRRDRSAPVGTSTCLCSTISSSSWENIDLWFCQ